MEFVIFCKKVFIKAQRHEGGGGNECNIFLLESRR